MAPKGEKNSAHLSMSIQIYFATQKLQDFNEKLSVPESVHKEKLQLSSGTICFILCCDNRKSNCR